MAYRAQAELGQYLKLNDQTVEAVKELSEAFEGLKRHQKSLRLRYQGLPSDVAKQLRDLAELDGDKEELKKWAKAVSDLQD